MPLTDAKLRALYGKPYFGKTELSDRDGLSARVTERGTISWQYRYRWQGKAARLKIGRYPDLKLADARALIPAIRGALERNEHPRVFWDKLHQKHDVTLKQCCEHFREHHLPKLRPRTVALYEHTMQRYFEPLFIGIPVEQIPFSSWLEWFDKIGKKQPKNAGHLLRRLKSILSFCIRRNLIGGSPVLNLRTEDVGSQPERGTRVLTMRELAQIWIAFEQSRASRGLKLAAKLVILLGCRSGEALGAQWSEFNLEEQIWTVPAARAKSGAPIRRPIPTRVMMLLQEAAAKSRLKGGPVCRSPVNPKQSLSSASLIQLAERVREKLDLPYWRMHDMRRTLSTRLSEERIMPQVTEKMLGHRMAGVMAIYNLHDWTNEQREAYELWDKKLMEAVKSFQEM